MEKIIILTGSGGKTKFINQLALNLSNHFEIEIFNSFHNFFLKKRSIRNVSQKIIHLIGSSSEIYLLGYSQGADILPFIFNSLDESIKNKVKRLILIGPASQADFSLGLWSYITGSYCKNSLPLMPEIEKINIPILCIYGENDSITIGPQLRKDNIDLHSIKSGHILRSKNVDQVLEILNEKIF
ncbi:MAG: AcvB/VirJ family lysyl-phosphatidylglycerol hydrolase [Bacteriovoracaceae bacterium]